MAKKMLIDATHSEETRVVVVQGNRLDDFDFESTNKQLVTGNIYLAKVTRVEPSLQAAFVDFGGNRHGFLAFSEIHPDYYQIPVADREALLAEEMEDALEDDEDDAEAEAPKARAKRSEKSEDEDGEDRPRSRRRRNRRRRGRDRKVVEIEIETGESEGGETTAETDGEVIEATAEEIPADAAEPEASSEETPAEDTSSEAPAEQEEVVEAEAAPEALETEAEASEETAAEETAAENTNDDDEGPKTVLMASDVRGDSVSEGDEPEIEDAKEDIAEASEEEAAAEDLTVDADAEDGETAETEDGSASSSSDGSSSDEDETVADASADDGPEEEDGENVTETDEDPEAGTAEEVETDAEPEAEEEVAAEAGRRRRQKRQARRRYKIQEVIKRRQIILVQVVKEERGNKGAALTTYLSLAGRYCVLMPNTARGGGISRKISNVTDRKRLKTVVSDLEVARGMGLIVRTAGANRTKGEIRRDYEYLLRLWESVRTLTLKSVAPTLVYEEGNLIKRSIRDLYSKEIDSILVQGERGYREAKDFMRMIMPSHAKHVHRYKDRIPLYHRYQVESQLESMYSPVVQLKSGGYLVINPTEALVSIDINSGKSTKEHNIEDTAVKTNLEAAEEISRQLRLRDLAGLVVIDFIDMEENRNTRAVERKLKDSLKHDRARIQVGRISSFGLLEMSRQRLRQGVVESSTHECPHCRGTGRVRSVESCALHVLRALEEECIRGRTSQLKVSVTSEVAIYLLNQKRHRLTELENRYKISVLVDIDNELIAPAHTIERMKGALPRPQEEEEVIRADSIELSELDEQAYDESVADEDTAETTEEEESEGRGRRRRRRRRRRGEKSSDDASAENAEQSDDAEKSENAEGDAERSEDEDGEGEGRGRRRRRGNRGRRRRGRRSEEETSEETGEETGEGADVEQSSEDQAETAETSETADEPTEDTPTVAAEDAPVAEAEEAPATEEVEDAPVAEETEVPAEEVAEAPAEKAKEDVEAPAEEPAVEEAETEASSEEPAPTEEPKPRRTGWWSRRFGGGED